MNALVLGTLVEQIARDNDANDVAYFAGYADGDTLLHLDGHSHSSVETLQLLDARYQFYAELEHPTSEARAYIAGYRDVAADNLPYPHHEIELRL
jgi:hypothetical protein